MTNTPDKSKTVEQRAREIYGQSPDVFWSHTASRSNPRHWGDLTEERREYFPDLARASSRPADQVPDMVERLARLLNSHFGVGNTEHWPVYTENARDILAALQTVPVTSGEPTEAMVKAGYDAAKKDGLTGPRKDCEQLVRLILTAALQASGEE